MDVAWGQQVDRAIDSADATASAVSRVSVVVPTYREADNLPVLIDRLEAVRDDAPWDLELLIVDDNSNDGTEEAIARLDLPWVRLIVRRDERGLSSAVLRGFEEATGDVLLCMDADLSHPPEKLPELVAALDEHEMVIGSRYVDGGSTDAAWGVFRWLNSKVATWLARPFTRAADPMAGFFTLRRTTYARATHLNPVGYKIGLELIVKCRMTRVGEVPIHFTERVRGESKLTLGEQLRYIQHLRRLFVWQRPNLSYVCQFGVVGLTGTAVNLATLTAALAVGAPEWLGFALAIYVSMTSNFLLNRRFTFSYARNGSWGKQYAGFLASSAIGAVVNYAVAMTINGLQPAWPPQVAAVFGILAGMGFNYTCSRYLVFRRAAE